MKYIYSVARVLCIIAPLFQIEAFIDLEEKIPSYVLETKKIEIPGYPDAFNPSIIRWNNSLLMSFRTGGSFQASEIDTTPFLMSFRIRNPMSAATNEIGLVLLNENFDPISTPQVLEIPHKNPLYAFRHQDPRLVAVGKRIYVVYSNIIEGSMVPEMRRVFVAELHFDGDRFFAGNPECLAHYEQANEHRWQKNWVPFDYKGHLLLAYSITPIESLGLFLGLRHALLLLVPTHSFDGIGVC